jgi:methylated-DNA-[protein]-cysteine S-methyltransferase
MRAAKAGTTAFQERVYSYLVKHVPAGKVTTYGAIAKALNTSARAVGQAMRHNPYAPRVPCHRVVASGGGLGGFGGKTSGKNIARKIEMLRKEGVKIENGKILKNISSASS